MLNPNHDTYENDGVNFIFVRMMNDGKNHEPLPYGGRVFPTGATWRTCAREEGIDISTGVFCALVQYEKFGDTATYKVRRLVHSSPKTARSMYPEVQAAAARRLETRTLAVNDPSFWRHAKKLGFCSIEERDQNLVRLDPTYQPRTTTLVF